jgi:hypothetical protein
VKSVDPDEKPQIRQVGWREWAAFPELGIMRIKAKIDTGARTSALHTFELETYTECKETMVRFGIHPLQRQTDLEIFCTAKVIDERVVRDSGGHPERRLVIRTPIRLGDQEWPIEVTLTNREDMLFRLLLGRSALTDAGLCVNPKASYLARSARRAHKTKLIRKTAPKGRL